MITDNGIRSLFPFLVRWWSRAMPSANGNSAPSWGHAVSADGVKVAAAPHVAVSWGHADALDVRATLVPSDLARCELIGGESSVEVSGGVVSELAVRTPCGLWLWIDRSDLASVLFGRSPAETRP